MRTMSWVVFISGIIAFLGSTPAAEGRVKVQIPATGKPAIERPNAERSLELIRTAGQLSWSVANKAELAHLLSDEAVVKAFLNTIANEGRTPELPYVEAVKEFTLADLRGDGSLELVVLMDETGRAFFNDIAIISRESVPKGTKGVLRDFEGFIERMVTGWNISDLDSSIKDLDGDGICEFIVPELLEQYHGADAHGILEGIFRWNGRDYENASSRYPWYYQQVVLPRLEQKLRLHDAGAAAAAADRRQTSEMRSADVQRRAKINMAIAEARKRAGNGK
jgi:hypothetical protein